MNTPPAYPPTRASAVAVQVRDLEVTYGTGTQALQRTSLDLREGEFVVLLGPSGAGKSTLLRTLNGLVAPTAGEVLVPHLGGALADRTRLHAHRRRTGMVFQQHHLIARQTVLANVLVGRLGWHRPWATLAPWREADKRLALMAIERVGLLDKALVRADALSGGQQQRVGIARALVQQPRLLLADEPVASLDPATAVHVLQLLHDICKHDGLTAVVSLHQVELARRFADRVIGLHQGAVQFDCAVGQLDAPGRIAALYAGASASAPASAPAPAPAPALPVQPLQRSAA